MDKTKLLRLDCICNGMVGAAMSKADRHECHFYFTLGDFNLRVGISPVWTLVLPIINKTSPALREARFVD